MQQVLIRFSHVPEVTGATRAKLTLGGIQPVVLTQDCPKIWRIATIIPLLKSGKPTSAVAFFCPVSLPSCIAKLMERILANRLYHIETSNMFSKLQAGFKKGRGCEDNI